MNPAAILGESPMHDSRPSFVVNQTVVTVSILIKSFVETNFKILDTRAFFTPYYLECASFLDKS